MSSCQIFFLYFPGTGDSLVVVISIAVGLTDVLLLPMPREAALNYTDKYTEKNWTLHLKHGYKGITFVYRKYYRKNRKQRKDNTSVYAIRKKKVA